MVGTCWVGMYSPVVDSDLGTQEDYDFEDEAYHEE
jgi:hypothetical protein